jgi:hypothetical protein
MNSKEFVLRRRLADGDGDNASGAGPFDAGEIAPYRAEFLLFGVKLLIMQNRRFDRIWWRVRLGDDVRFLRNHD